VGNTQRKAARRPGAADPIAEETRRGADERVLDKTQGNLKAVQKLLGHSSISTTADTYVDWDIDQLAETLRAILNTEGER
jgi:integrase